MRVWNRTEYVLVEFCQEKNLDVEYLAAQPDINTAGLASTVRTLNIRKELVREIKKNKE